MKLSNLVPWSGTPRASLAPQDRTDPLSVLQGAINRAFGEFWGAVEGGPWDRNDPRQATLRVDVHDAGKAIDVTAELPGMNESDIELSLADGMLSIRGEKKVERKTEEKGYVLRERSYGTMERVVPLPEGLDVDSAKATFKDGTLTVMIPKKAEADRAIKRIHVQAA
jgi:HSP20 family protein